MIAAAEPVRRARLGLDLLERSGYRYDAVRSELGAAGLAVATPAAGAQ